MQRNVHNHTRAVAKGAKGVRAHPPNPCALHLFWRCRLTHAPTLGYMNVFSDTYLAKTQPCIPAVLLDQVLADDAVW